MESHQAFRCCMRPSILPHSISPRSSSCLSKALRHPHRKRKLLPESRATRHLSTTCLQSQEDNLSSPKIDGEPQSQPQPQSQSPPTPSRTAPRPSAWGSLIQGQRPHATSPNLSAADREALSQKLRQRVNTLDLIPERKPSRNPRPTAPGLTQQINQEITTLGAKNTHAALAAVHLRLTPMLGRTLPVEPGSGLDLQSAFRVLDIRCALNKVKRDSYSQETHVRKGQMRKTLKSKRWRAQFMHGFLNELGRVRRMKKQGW